MGTGSKFNRVVAEEIIVNFLSCRFRFLGVVENCDISENIHIFFRTIPRINYFCKIPRNQYFWINKFIGEKKIWARKKLSNILSPDGERVLISSRNCRRKRVSREFWLLAVVGNCESLQSIAKILKISSNICWNLKRFCLFGRFQHFLLF